MLKISFVIPLYNCENYIEDCLNSISKITYENYEVIVINDGSTDDSLIIAQNYTKGNDKVQIYTKKNEGLSLTRNYGINKSTGDYLFFVDADDMIIPDQVDNIIKICLENIYDVVAGTYLFFYEEENELIKAPFNLNKNINSQSDLYHLLNLPHYTAEAIKYIVKREFIINNDLFFEPNIYHEDELYMPQLLTTVANDKICIFYSPFYLYRKHSNTITTTKNVKKSFDTLYICNKLYKMSQSVYKNDLIKYNFIIKRANLSYISTCSLLYKFSFRQQKQIINQLKPIHTIYSNHLYTFKDKTAKIIIDIFGYRFFSVLQLIRKIN